MTHPTASRLEPIEKITEMMISGLSKRGIAYEPGALMQVLRDRAPKWAMPWACAGLANLGAVEAVPVLKELADFPVADVKATSVLSVARLAGRSETTWLLECLEAKGTDKGYVLWALASTADPRALPAVLPWFRKQLRKLERRPEQAGHGAFVFAAAYLEQQHPSNEIAELLERLGQIVPSLPGNISSQLRSFTYTFSHVAKEAG